MSTTNIDSHATIAAESQINAITTTLPRPYLAGLRIIGPDGKYYLIDPDGYRRYIVNADTYNELFKDWNGAIGDTGSWINQIQQGDDIADGSYLASSQTGQPSGVYLVVGTDQEKHHIFDPDTMAKYYLNWDKVTKIQPETLIAIPTGLPWR